MSLLRNYLPSFTWSGSKESAKDTKDTKDTNVKDPVGYGILAGMLIGSFFSTFTILLVFLGVLLLSRPEMQTFIDIQMEKLLHSAWMQQSLDIITNSLFGKTKDPQKKKE